MENGHLVLDLTLAHFSTMISRLVIKFFTQIQAHQEMHQFGRRPVVLPISLLSRPCLLSAFSPAAAGIMKVLGLTVGATTSWYSGILEF